MKGTKNDKIRKKIIIGAALLPLMCTFILFQCNFFMYGLTFFLYEKTDANVESIEKYALNSRNNVSDNWGVSIADVNYCINGHDYRSNVIVSYKEKENDKIVIAYQKKHPDKIIRCQLLPLSPAAWTLDAIGIVVLLFYIGQTVTRKHSQYKGRGR